MGRVDHEHQNTYSDNGHSPDRSASGDNITRKISAYRGSGKRIATNLEAVEAKRKVVADKSSAVQAQRAEVDKIAGVNTQAAVDVSAGMPRSRFIQGRRSAGLLPG
jgi:hypothetical protein